MTLPMLDRTVLVGRRAQIAQLQGIHDSKTDQTAQTDQRIETAGEFGAIAGQKLTSPHPKLTSGTARRPDSRAPSAKNPSSRALQGAARRLRQ